MSDILIVVPSESFTDEEYFSLRAHLENKRQQVIVASTQDVAKSADEGKEIVVDLLTDEADVADYDAVVFVGGPGVTEYFEDEKVLEMCYQTVEQGKILAAIGAAPGVLARAGVLNGKQVASMGSEHVALDESGAITSDSHIVVDGQIITADTSSVAKEFAEKIIEGLGNSSAVSDPVEEEKNLPIGVQEYYPSTEEKEETSEQADEGFPENQPYYEEGKTEESASETVHEPSEEKID